MPYILDSIRLGTRLDFKGDIYRARRLVQEEREEDLEALKDVCSEYSSISELLDVYALGDLGKKKTLDEEALRVEFAAAIAIFAGVRIG